MSACASFVTALITQARTRWDVPNLGQDERAVLQPRTVAMLVVGEGVVAVLAMKARKAWLFTGLKTAEDGLMCVIEPGQHIVQHVAVDGG